jgi:hypothetical protein
MFLIPRKEKGGQWTSNVPKPEVLCRLKKEKTIEGKDNRDIQMERCKRWKEMESQCQSAPLDPAIPDIRTNPGLFIYLTQ